MVPLLRAAALAVVLVFASSAGAADKRPMKLDDMFAFKRVAAPQISPDGKHVAYQVGTVNLKENKTSTAIWVAATDGKTPPKQLTDPKGKRDAAPRWSPDGEAILFESSRSGSSQLWVVSAEGGEPKQLTDISTGAATGIWSPDGKAIAFVSSVYPEFSEKPFVESDKLNKEKDAEIESNPVKAKVFTKLFFRHWDEYVGDKRQHIFVITAHGDIDDRRFVTPRDATPGDRDANPTSMTFSSGDDFTFTPDSKHIVFTAVPEKDEAWSTNYDICRVSITNTSPKWECLTKDNKAADSGPKFSPDGKRLAWRAQQKAGYEADKWDIVVTGCNPNGTLKGELDKITAKTTPDVGTNLEGKEASVNEFAWGVRSEAMEFGIQFTADNRGRTRIYEAVFQGGKYFIGSGLLIDPLNDNYANPTQGSVSGLSRSKDGKRWVFLVATLNSPAVIAGVQVRAGAFDPFDKNKTLLPNSLGFGDSGTLDPNKDLLAELDRTRPEAVEVPVEGGVKMHMWVQKPPGFDPQKKWPVVYLVHGGPQGAWEDSWSYRWNPQLWAAQGYVVVMPNPRGSTGFGQKFVDEITADWGGKCYRDLVAGLDYVEKMPYVDKDRIASAGGSFGGYMQNWFAVNDVAKRFKCLITHCSVWNFESMWGTTDELWFDEYEHGGLPWEIPGKYREFSPHAKAGKLKEYKTPMLVIHNDNDFRCPIGQGHELFTALQRNGVPSRFVNFPDEGHWVLKPRNSERWHKEVFGWLAKYAPPGGK